MFDLDVEVGRMEMIQLLKNQINARICDFDLVYMGKHSLISFRRLMRCIRHYIAFAIWIV